MTITLGANDGFLLEEACASQPDPAACIEAGVPTLLATVASNMQTILGDLRAGGYYGAIVITNYYSLDYSDAAATGLTALLNQAIEAPAAAYGAVVADLFTAFKTVAVNCGVRRQDVQHRAAQCKRAESAAYATFIRVNRDTSSSPRPSSSRFAAEELRSYLRCRP